MKTIKIRSIHMAAKIPDVAVSTHPIHALFTNDFKKSLKSAIKELEKERSGCEDMIDRLHERLGWESVQANKLLLKLKNAADDHAHALGQLAGSLEEMIETGGFISNLFGLINGLVKQGEMIEKRRSLLLIAIGDAEDAGLIKIPPSL